jgi:hypothetical protein
MDTTRDNPLARFAAFFWAIGTISLFFVVLFLVRLTKAEPAGNPMEIAAAAKRYEIRKTVEAAEAANLGYKALPDGAHVQVPPSDVFGLVGKALVNEKPVAVNKPEQAVPAPSNP